MHTVTRHLSHSLWLLALVALVLVGCNNADGSEGEAEDAQAQRQIRVETLLLEPSRFEDIIELTGTVEALNDAALSAQASGTVEYLADLGTALPRGGVVARLDRGQVRAAVQQAEAQVEAAQAQFDLAQDNFERQEPLYRDSIISALEFENVRAQRNQARASLRQAEAALAQAQERLDDTVIRAPFAGIVEERFIEAGEQIVPGQRVARVVSTERVRVNTGVPERYASEIEVGTPVRMNFKAYGDVERQGRVTFAGSTINPQSRTFPVEIEVDNPNGRLKPEMVAQLYVSRAVLDSALVVPRSAIIRDENGNSVFVVNRTDSIPTAERHRLTLGPNYAGKAVVEEGLQAGDEVVVLGQNNLTEGDPLNVVDQYTRVDASGVPLKESTDQPTL
ncbi:MAG: efflux RND transporter periplasmic adaptor subunit [Bacteroidetes bacterium]|jgi:membrane fusion protein (multidrug efflux system)|nr:efflux RND transporter periplasmic adaptor subunit [Bacteroidota bacterium]